MIRVLQANPAMDRIEVLARFDLDAVNRSFEVHVMPGGKGLNVARGIRDQVAGQVRRLEAFKLAPEHHDDARG